MAVLGKVQLLCNLENDVLDSLRDYTSLLTYLEQLNSAKGAEECYRPRKAMADPSCLG